MNKLLAVVVVAFLGPANPAHAALIDVTLGSTSSNFSYSTGGAALVPNVNLLSLGSNLTTYGAVIVNPPSTFPGDYIEPSGPLYGNNYLVVFGNSSATGSATITLATSQNTFGFTWGTIDAYNTLKLTDSRGDTYTITGSELLSQIAGGIPGTTQSDVNFIDPYGTIVTAQLTSTANSFEAGNFSEVPPSPVPVPASLPLFALALVGLFVVARRNADRSI